MMLSSKTFVPRYDQFKLHSEAQISSGIYESGNQDSPNLETLIMGIGPGLPSKFLLSDTKHMTLSVTALDQYLQAVTGTPDARCGESTGHFIADCGKNG